MKVLHIPCEQGVRSEHTDKSTSAKFSLSRTNAKQRKHVLNVVPHTEGTFPLGYFFLVWKSLAYVFDMMHNVLSSTHKNHMCIAIHHDDNPTCQQDISD